MPHPVEHSTAVDEPAPHGPSAVGLRDAKLGGWYREDSGELFRGVPIGAGDVVVDVGCGAGVNSVFCARHGARVYAIDREPQVIREVRARLSVEGRGTQTALVSDANPLPLDDGIATRVICSGCARGIRSEARFAPWIAAMRATPSTSPFLALPARTIASVAGCISMRPPAIATRWVSSFAPTSTIGASRYFEN